MLFQFHLKNNYKDFFMRSIAFLFLVFAAVQMAAAEYKNISYYEKNAPAQGNVEYRNQRCKLSLLTPDNKKGFPTLVVFHGGGLSRGEGKYPAYINRDNIALVAVNYRLSGKGGACPDYIYDAAAAVAWVIKNIEKYGGDSKKVYVTGVSAGGYLTAMIALDKKYLASFGIDTHAVAGYFPITGQMSTHFRILKERRDVNPSTRDFAIDEYAPLYHACKNAPNMMFFVGDPAYDMPARVEENALIVARLTTIYGNKGIKLFSVPYGTHSNCVPPSLAAIDRLICPPQRKR